MLNQDRAGRPATRPLTQANIQVLRQLSDTLAGLDHTGYTHRGRHGSSSIGRHVRHVIDHYRCFFRRADGKPIDYDDRARQSGIETGLPLALKALSDIMHQLSRFEAGDNGNVEVRISSSPGLDPEPVESSLQRELLFLQSHTIHHMAVIHLMLNLLSIPVDPLFAMAPSTLDFLARNGNGHE